MVQDIHTFLKKISQTMIEGQRKKSAVSKNFLGEQESDRLRKAVRLGVS